MPIQTPIRGLRSFCVAAKCLSFKHAADQLYLTPSAVSHQIKQLEEQLGQSLFVRQTRAIELTRTGRQFYHAIQPLITELEQTVDDFTKSAPNQNITISLPEFFASELFVPKLNAWSKEHPDVNLQLATVKSGNEPAAAADISIILSSGKLKNGVSTELFPVRYAAACNKALYSKWAGKGKYAINQVPLILHKARPWAWHQWADRSQFNNFEPQQIIQFDSMFGVARAAQQGLGIALVPLPIAQQWFSEQTLVKLFDQELITKDRYFLVEHENSQKCDQLKSLCDWIKSEFSDMY